MIYLASPYSHPNPLVQEIRFQQVSWAAAKLIEAGNLVFGPISHSHPITKYGGNGSWEYWEKFDRIMFDACDVLWVLTLDGWDESKGVGFEMAWAQEAKVPVRMVSLEEIGAMAND